MFIDSIFDRLWHKVEFIDFQKFCETVGVSVLGFEVVEMTKTSFEGCIGRQSIYFQAEKCTNDIIEKHEMTKISLKDLIK
jgi:hypothetical protein